MKAPDDPLQFSLQTLLLTATGIAALFATTGQKAFAWLPLLFFAGLAIGWVRMRKRYGPDAAFAHLRASIFTGIVTPFACCLVVGVLALSLVAAFCVYDLAFDTDVTRRWLLAPRAGAIQARESFDALWFADSLRISLLIGAPWFVAAWFVSSRPWARAGCWSCPAAFLAFCAPGLIGECAPSLGSESSFRLVGLALMIDSAAFLMFLGGLLGDRVRRRRQISANTKQRPA